MDNIAYMTKNNFIVNFQNVDSWRTDVKYWGTPKFYFFPEKKKPCNTISHCSVQVDCEDKNKVYSMNYNNFISTMAELIKKYGEDFLNELEV